jgi:RHS repeat-associated protein
MVSYAKSCRSIRRNAAMRVLYLFLSVFLALGYSFSAGAQTTVAGCEAAAAVALSAFSGPQGICYPPNGGCTIVTQVFGDPSSGNFYTLVTIQVGSPPFAFWDCGILTTGGGNSGGGGKSLGGDTGSVGGGGDNGSGSGNRGCSDKDTNSVDSQPGQYSSDPINETNGNLYQVVHDYGGYGPCPLVFNRYYNSLGSASGSLGRNWSHSYSASITQTSSTSVQVTRASQKTLTFNLVGSTWTPDPDVNDRLVQQTNSSGATTGWVLTAGNDSIETYNAAGVLISIATRAGLTQTLSYNGQGQLSTVTDPFGRKLTFTYDGSGRISTMTDPAGRINTYSYDASNNLASVTWPDGTSQQYVYEHPAFPNALTGIFDELGTRYVTFTYNSAGLAVASNLSGGVERYSFAYNLAGNSTASMDALGRTTTYNYTPLFGISHTASVTGPLPGGGTAQNALTYDANGNIASYTDFNGNKTTYSYDLTRNLQLQVTRPDGRITTTTWHPTFRLPVSIVTGPLSDQRSYDAHGNLLTRSLADTSIPYSRTWSYTYNANGQPLTITDPNGNVTTYAYDATGDVSSETDPLGHVAKMIYDGEGKRLSTTDPNGLVTTYSYDARGRLVKVVAGSLTTAYAYSPTGTLSSVSWPSGYGITNTYDGAHRLIGIADAFGNQISYMLDPLNNRTGETHTSASGGTVYAHSWAYDVLNRIAQSIGASGQTTNLVYDANGNLLSVSDPLGHVTTMSYDSINRLAQVTAADGGDTIASYDQFDHLIGVTDPRNAKTTYAIDAVGNTRTTNSPDAGASTATPDAVGNVVKRVDANGHPLAYSYDPLNRLVQVSRTDTNTVLETYTYDQTDSAHSNGVGHLTSMADPSGTTNWSYDANGHMLKKTQSTGRFTFVTSYGYDPSTGNLASVTFPSGAALKYTWVNGRVANVAVTIKGVTTSLVAGLQYEPFGGPSSWILGNSEADGRSFDLDGRVTTDGVDTAISYDASSRITGVTLTGTGGSRSYQYDVVGRLTGLTSTDGTQPSAYRYDPAGNRVQQSIGNATTSYAFAAGSNRLLSASSKNSTTAYSYDADGSRISEGTIAYMYDVFERLTTGAGPNGNETYVYNGFGQRVVKYGKASGNAATYFVYDEAAHLVGEYNTSGQPFEETVYLGDMPIAVIMPAGVYYVHSDYRNTPRQIDNITKVAVWSWDPRAFGDSKPSQDLSGTTFTYNLRFPGQYYDGETLKNYNYFRTYDFSTGGYLESDPIGLKGGLNTYTYAMQDPVARTDPTGQLLPIVCGAILFCVEDPVVCAQIAACAAGLGAGLANAPGGNVGGNLGNLGTPYSICEGIGNAIRSGGPSTDSSSTPKPPEPGVPSGCQRDPLGGGLECSPFAF